jgi:SAM-dependent methyltransferase
MRLVNHVAYRLAVDEYQGQLGHLLPLNDQSRVLQMRCDWGAIAFNLATRVASVVGIDDRITRLRFASARCRQEGVKNLHLVRVGAPCPLPFADGSFDAAIVLDPADESVVDYRTAGASSPSAILAEVKRVLRQGGSLLLGVANRLGLGRQRNRQQQALTYWGCISALKEAGFTPVGFFAALPSYHEPFFIVPLDRMEPVRHFIDSLLAAEDYRAKLEERGLTLIYRLALTGWRVGRRLGLARLIRFAVPSYVVVARAQGD